MLPEAIGLLVVEYWMSPSKAHNAGVHFDNGYASEALAHILHSVMQKQTEFSLPVDFGRQGLQQIATPAARHFAYENRIRELIHLFVRERDPDKLKVLATELQYLLTLERTVPKIWRE